MICRSSCVSDESRSEARAILAIVRDHVGGKDVLVMEPLTSSWRVRMRSRQGSDRGHSRQWRGRRDWVAARPHHMPRRRADGLSRGGRVGPWEGDEREHGAGSATGPPEWDWRQVAIADLDGSATISVGDLQEHVADGEGRALVMGDEDLDLFHVGHSRGGPSTSPS